MRKILALALCAFVLFSLVSCSKKTAENNDEEEIVVTDENGETKKVKKSSKKISLYFCYSDSLDPYKAKSSGNRSVCGLLFDPLIKLDNDLNPHKVIASDIQQSGKTITVTLGSRSFSDGSSVTTDDVIYSIERCKKAKEGAYVNQLENVKSYYASSGRVIITLKRYDRNAVNLLDFPILKRGTAGKTNDDGKPIPPVGSGRYVFVDDVGNYSLEGNEYYYKGKPKNKIKLNSIPDYEALEYLIRSSSISVYYSGFDATEMPELKGKTKSVTLTNLVYLGINHTRSVLGDKNIRKALSAAVDRSNISQKCYYSLSVPALSLFNQKNKAIENENDIFNLEDNVPSAAEFMKKSGYGVLNSNGYYENEQNQHIELGLLYNKDNNIQNMAADNLIKQFKAAGISIKDDGAVSDTYKSRVNSGNYDIYLAEIRLTKSFDYTPLLNEKIVTAAQKKSDDKKADDEEGDTETEKETEKKENTDRFSKAYESYMKGNTSANKMLETFADEMPFIPLVFRLGTVSYSDDFSDELISSISDPYYNIESISLK